RLIYTLYLHDALPIVSPWSQSIARVTPKGSGWIYANQVFICTQGVQIFHSSHYRAPTRRIVRERGAMSDMGNRFRALDVLRGLRSEEHTSELQSRFDL